MPQKNKTIGVLGGMGPEASSNLYAKIIQYAQQEYGAVQDFDYPPIIIYSLPLFGFDETGIVDEDLVKKQLIEGVKKLESAGCDLIIVACNTVHSYYDEMQSAVKVPIFNIIEETRKRVLEFGYKKVGLFASESTNKLKLYQKRFADSNIKVISPNTKQQRILNQVIERVMGGNQKKEDIILLKDIARDYLKQGAEAIVLGCTEIPLAINQTHTDIKLFDTIEIIVQCAVDYSLKK
ncbi:MAG: aspartate racemase, aspartate racemase [archaeon GW2011_AR9]|nr:MAG: aspartate racemase, aspartate racemase [archaeon GW2011_AR9]HIH13185.1 amino acid racemase [Candidatus Woesearchaeota archaeon]